MGEEGEDHMGRQPQAGRTQPRWRARLVRSGWVKLEYLIVVGAAVAAIAAFRASIRQGMNKIATQVTQQFLPMSGAPTADSLLNR